MVIFKVALMMKGIEDFQSIERNSFEPEGFIRDYHQSAQKILMIVNRKVRRVLNDFKKVDRSKLGHAVGV